MKQMPFDLKHGDPPQRSCIGYSISNLHISFFYELTKQFKIIIHGYVDDHQPYIFFSPTSEDIKFTIYFKITKKN